MSYCHQSLLHSDRQCITVGVWIASEEVMDKVILSPVLARVETELLEAMVTLGSVGGVLSNRTADPLSGAGNSVYRHCRRGH